MRRLRVGVLDLVTRNAHPSLYGRLMNANFASIMPQALGVWCEEAGHRRVHIGERGGMAVGRKDPLDIAAP